VSEIAGVVVGHRDGHGFLQSTGDQPALYLSPQEMRTVLHGDRVTASIVRYDRKGRPEGHVLEIIERKKSPIIGRLLHEGGIWIVAPEDKRYGQDIIVPKSGLANASVGQVVAVELTEPASLFSKPVGRVTEVLGEIDDPGMEIEIAVRKYEVPHRFSAATLAQAAALPEKIRSSDRRGRIDLTDVALVTIDGEDARDFDDAVYCEAAKLGRGESAPDGWRLIVAIADVSHYVKPGEPVDIDAYERATSVYFPRRVIPMLPEELSNGLCSLNPNEDRLAMVCDMLITRAGEIHAYQFFPAVIRSHARFTYEDAAAMLANTNGPLAAKYAELVPHLLNLHEVYRALLKERRKRGAIDFETTETQIVCDSNGRIEKIVPRTRTDAHKLIEECMLATNVCSAEFIARARHPSLYRVHEGPTPEKRTLLQNYLKALGLGMSISNSPKPSEYQVIAAATKERADAQQIHMMLLRSMQQAVYSGANLGHFGLAYEAYTHFTSPIRRYPDLLVHRVIKALLTGKRYSLISGDVAVASKVKKSAGLEEQRWELAGEHCSANERRADEASRDVEAWLKCRYMRQYLGSEFGGTVSAVTSFGLFVQLDGIYVEGLVHITELGGEYFRFDEARQELWGERSGTRYTVGSHLRVQVSRVDLDSRKIDFRLVREGAYAAPPSRARRGKRSDKPQQLNVDGDPIAVKPADPSKKSGKSRSGGGLGERRVRTTEATQKQRTHGGKPTAKSGKRR